jgi:hypothetical protein
MIFSRKRLGETNGQQRMPSLVSLLLGAIVLVLTRRKPAPSVGYTATPTKTTDSNRSKRLALNLGILAALALAIALVVTDRPLTASTLSSSNAPTFSVGTMEEGDFADVSFSDVRLELEGTARRRWEGTFEASFVAKSNASGAFVVVLPSGTRIRDVVTPAENGIYKDEEVAKKFPLGLSNSLALTSTTVTIGFGPIALNRFPYNDNGRAKDGLLKFRFMLTEPLARRIGYGRTEFRIRYLTDTWVVPRNFKPFPQEQVSYQGGINFQPDGEPPYVKLGIRSNPGRIRMEELAPDPTGREPSMDYWTMNPEVLDEVHIEGVAESIWVRWLVDRLPDLLFTLFGYLLGIYSATLYQRSTAT